MICWPAELERMVAEVCGPEDQPDERVNGDVDATSGDDDFEPSFEADEDEPDTEAEW